MPGVLTGRRDTLVLICFYLYLCDRFYSRHISTAGARAHGVHYGGGARGDVCLNGWGLKPMVGHRTTGTMNSALDRCWSLRRDTNLTLLACDNPSQIIQCRIYFQLHLPKLEHSTAFMCYAFLIDDVGIFSNYYNSKLKFGGLTIMFFFCSQNGQISGHVAWVLWVVWVRVSSLFAVHLHIARRGWMKGRGSNVTADVRPCRAVSSDTWWLAVLG